MARTSKIQKHQNQNCRPHVHRVRQEPQWGLQFCFFFEVLHGLLQMARTSKIKKTKLQTPLGLLSDSVDMWSAVLFFVFFGFSRFWPFGADHAKTSKIQKKQKTKLQTTCPQSQTFAPMGSDFLFFRGFCMVCFAVYCCYHIKPFKTLQNQNFHISPPLTPPPKKNGCPIPRAFLFRPPHGA